MEKLVKLVRTSSKEAFRKLRDSGEIECVSLERKFKITGLFLRHISGKTKTRKIRDIIERLTIINLIDKISKEGKLVEERKDIFVEKKYYFTSTYKIFLNISDLEFFLVIGEKKDNSFILITVFLNYAKK